MRLLLDTNVWSRITDHGAQEDFYRYAKASKFDVLAAPAALLELLRSPNDSSRAARARLICRSRWTRLSPEAESESLELVACIEQFQPNWMRSSVDHVRLGKNREWWRNRVWAAARHDDPALVAKARSHRAHDRAEYVRGQKLQRQVFQEHRILRSLEELGETLASGCPSWPQPGGESEWERRGWKPGTRVDLWRCQLLWLMQWELISLPRQALMLDEPATYAEWVGAFVDMERIAVAPERLGEIILYDADPVALKRFWLRFAVDLAQHTLKVSDGNTCDSQLASYLYEADVFLTADKRFARILGEVSRSAPAPFAQVFYLDPAAPALVQRLDLLLKSVDVMEY